MSDINPVHIFGSVAGTVITVILGKITQLTSNDISAFATIFAGTTTGIFSALKAYEWFEKKWERRRYERKHKNPR